MKRVKSILRNIYQWWLRKKKGITLTFIISIVGGIPGMIGIYKSYYDRPELGFYTRLAGGMSFDFRAKGDSLTLHKAEAYIITGALYNSGNEPFFPSNFKLGLKYSDLDDTLFYGVTSMSEKNLSRGSFSFLKSGKLIDATDLTIINQKDAKWVYFIFENFDKNIRELNSADGVFLYSLDVLNKERIIKIVMRDGEKNAKSYYDPFTGMEINDIRNRPSK